MSLNYSFDRVNIRHLDNRVDAVTPDEFLAIKLNVRMQLLLEKRIEFYNGSTVVPQREALHALRVRAAEMVANQARA